MMQSMRCVLNANHKKLIKYRSISNLQQEIIRRDDQYGGHHFKPLPVVLDKGEGANLWDIDGKRYLDFLAGFSTCNQGHCHPRLVKVMRDQCGKLHHTSRAYYTEMHGELAEYLTRLFKFDRFIPMNTGVEGADLSIKLARRWGYKIKKIPYDKASVIFAEKNFWGRSLAAASASTEPLCYNDFGPLMPNFEKIPYDDLEDGYLKGVRDLCNKYNVLWIADEVQTGLGRTGYRVAVDHEQQKPDILVLGKALSGGIYPVSGILSNHKIVLNLDAGSHGSTFGGSPLACSVALEAVKIIEEEKLADNAKRLGEIVKEELGKIPKDIASDVRGRGLLCGLMINKEFANGWDVCLRLRDKGLLSRPAHGQLLRISPPLVITEEQLREGLEIIKTTLINY
ncbi:hypothetical protein PV327_001774 [Microctonus hyperodae]|uniref:Ornithine aminotransferase n=1 Tax=Microctonus hyperodae TaxID=165561 RepID=A0AA39KNM2_MICHY|nr:hypothetical protein PV327_001774 [Microctonus hyperodae]